MIYPTCQIESIQRHARAAAEAGSRPSVACPFPLGTAASKYWYSQFLIRELELADEVTA